MQKTHKSISKRFKITGTGKVTHRSGDHGHLLRNKSVKRKRRACQDHLVSPGFSSHVLRAMPFSH